MVEDTETYYRRREREELEAAQRATDPVAADIHRSLAARYSVLNGHLRVLDTPSPRILDCGAHVGLVSLWLKRRLFPAEPAHSKNCWRP